MTLSRIRRSVTQAAIIGLIVAGFGGCGRVEHTAEEITAYFDEIPPSQAPSIEKKQEESKEPEEPESTPEPVVLDILTKIQVEAGTAEQITAADLFEEYDAQQVVFETNLSAEQLAAAGAVYEINVVYMEQTVSVMVECIDTIPPVIEGGKGADSKRRERHILQEGDHMVRQRGRRGCVQCGCRRCESEGSRGIFGLLYCGGRIGE